MGSMKAKIDGKEVDFSMTTGRQLRGRNNGQDFGDLEKGPFSQMFISPVVLGQAVWANFSDRIEEATSIDTEESFLDVIDGDTRRGLESALKESFIDFFSWGEKMIQRLEAKMATLGDEVNPSEQSGQASGSTPES